ncbi:cobalt-precorrin 5A hydrolase [Petrocella sp. FN5]|uniref:cobalt-precorrin 5A hydrolase n=1 Tax=Petrocella sp. FN5 TaxID=3032002 RepID=UPI0023DA7C16|nr:cobalamin biosynthesis protein [Petrocella sp. FN5]MDF1617649.1 cobalamin biosynthesis protein [Petrocella sp. FN5]
MNTELKTNYKTNHKTNHKQDNNTLILSLTPKGDLLNHRLKGDHYTSEIIKEQGGIMACVKAYFNQVTCMVFICATGIAVRAIGKLIEDKYTDPAVLVIDEEGRYVISLLSGHMGGGNAYAKEIGKLIKADPIITTSTDVNDVGNLDLLLQACHCDVPKYRDNILKINMALIKGESIGLYCDIGPGDTRLEPYLKGFTLEEDFQIFIEMSADYKVYIGYDTRQINKLSQKDLYFIPKVLCLGTGTRKNLDTSVYFHELDLYLKGVHVHPSAIALLTSVEIKSQEPCLEALCQAWSLESLFFTVQDLESVHNEFDKSEWVLKTLGIGSVAGPSAWLASKGNMIHDGSKMKGSTFALGRIV